MILIPPAPEPWWRIPLDVLVACSTIAVGFFAGVELWRARAEKKARMKVADARVSALAFALRRQLQWLLAKRVATVEEAIRLTEFQPHHDAAETRMLDLLSTGVESTPAVQECLREAYVRFYRAVGAIDPVLRKRFMGSIPGEETMFLNYWMHLEACISMLSRVVDPALENSDNRVAVEEDSGGKGQDFPAKDPGQISP